MGLKGINPFEQHVEKIFFGVMGAAAVGVLVWQFVGPRNTVTVGKDNSPVDQAFERIAQEAAKVKARTEAIELPKDPPLPDKVEPVERLLAFRSEYAAPVSPSKALATAVGVPPLNIGGPVQGIGAQGAAAPIAALAVPATSRPVAAAYMVCVHPAEAFADPEVARVLPAQLPFDKASVTVEAMFPSSDLKALLQNDPDGEGPMRAFPPHWWQGGEVELLAIEMEREERTATGEWTGLTSVPIMPGRLSLAPRLKDPPTRALIKELMVEAASNATEVRRPSYFREIFGEAWVPPTEIVAPAAAAGNAEQIELVKRRYEKAVADGNRYQEQLDKELGGGGDRQPPGGPRGPRGPRGPGGGGGERPPPPDQPDGESLKVRNLRRALERAQKDIDDLRRQLRELGAPVEGDVPPPPVAPPPGTGPDGSRVEPALLDADATRVWSHDVSVERGKVYRYRLAIWINNPVFGNKTALPPEQAALAEPAFLRGEVSEWSDPVKVDDQTYYFVTSASEPVSGLATTARANAELYAFQWGFWRKAGVSLEPGDRIAAEARVPDFTAVVGQMAEGQQPGAPGAPAPLPPGAPRDPRLPTPPPGGPRTLPSGPAPEAPVAGEAVPMGPLAIESDSFLLDVTEAITLREPRPAQAVLRSSDGSIESRTPDEEKRSPVYVRVSRSAEAGERELRPKAPTGDRPPAPSGPGRQAPPEPGRDLGPGGG